MLKLHLQRQTRITPQPSHLLLQTWLNAAWQDEAIRANAPTPLSTANHLALCIVGARAGKNFNQTYRNKDYATNILSFPYTLPTTPDGQYIQADPSLEGYLGDLIVCAPVVHQEATAQNKDLMAHWAHLCVHGVLHLLGFDHIVEQEAEIMENHERRILQKLGFADPYLVF